MIYIASAASQISPLPTTATHRQQGDTELLLCVSCAGGRAHLDDDNGTLPMIPLSAGTDIPRQHNPSRDIQFDITDMEISPPASLSASQHYEHSVHYFQPPKSPIVAGATPSLASGQDYFSTSTRKRQRPDSAHNSQERRQQTASWAETPRWAQCPTPGDNIYGSGEVNERYRLADGFDTPGVQSTSRLEQLTVPENEFRRRRRDDDDMDFTMRSGCTPLSGPLARERNGVARVRPASDQHLQTTWTSLAFNIISKAFSFGSTVFRGFSAGGGMGYDVHGTGLAGSDMLENSRDGVSTPIPGSWHEAETDFLGDFEQDSPNFNHGSPSRPAVKRRQTDRDSWILVDSSHLDGRPSSPRRKISGNGEWSICRSPDVSLSSHSPRCSAYRQAVLRQPVFPEIFTNSTTFRRSSSRPCA